MVEPVDPFERVVFDGAHGFPWSSPPDDFGLVEPIDGFGEGVVITVTDTADRRLQTCFCEAPCMPYDDLLSSVIRVMNKTASDARPAIVQSLFECIEPKARMRRPADPEPVRCRGLEVGVHMVERARRCLVAAGRAMRLASDNTLQPHGLDEAPDSATSKPSRFIWRQTLLAPWTVKFSLKTRRISGFSASSRRTRGGLRPPPRVRLMIGGWGARQYPADRLDPINITMIVNEANHVFGRRSSSACAK